MVGTLSDINPVALALAHLRADAEVVAAFASGAIGGQNTAPYPRLRVHAGSGSDGDLRWLIYPEIIVEVYDDPMAPHGDTVLRKLLYIALESLARWPSLTIAPGQPVVSRVVSTATATPNPLADGQQRWTAAMRLHVHPAGS